MAGVFISYRREDSAPYTGRIYDALRSSFPDVRVFMDIDAIDPGDDFVATIDRTLAQSQVVVAVIGPKWLAVTNQDGLRRLDSPDDYVVSELHAALEKDVCVMPVLVGGANMPPPTALPVPLRSLARRNAIEISDTRFRADMDRLSDAISNVIEKSVQPFRDEPSRLLALTNFKRLILMTLAAQVLSLLVGAFRDPGGLGGALIAAGLIAGITGWLSFMLLKGKGWARILFILMQPLTLAALFAGGYWAIAPSVSYALFCVGLVWMMFTDPIKRIFVRHQIRLNRR
jgi:hypothetical protein